MHRDAQCAVMRALTFEARHKRHRRIPVDSGLQNENGLRHLVPNLKTYHFLVIGVRWFATWSEQKSRKPREHQVLDEMTRVLHISEKSQNFPTA